MQHDKRESINQLINRSEFFCSVLDNRATSKPLGGFSQKVKLGNNVRIGLVKQICFHLCEKNRNMIERHIRQLELYSTHNISNTSIDVGPVVDIM